jgi:hypothetical protein
VQPVNTYAFDSYIQESQQSADAANAIITQLIVDGAKIIYMRYIESQKMPYACRTLGRELVLNASWASIPLDMREIVAEPDADLGLPPIDEWAGGVLPVRNSDPASLRTSVTPQREFRKTITLYRSRITPDEESEKKPGPTNPRPVIPHSPTNKSAKPKKQIPTLSEAEIITRAFEEARKKTNMSMKALTVDSDFTVIPIAELKGLPPALIIPAVSTKTKAAAAPKSTSVLSAIPKVARPTPGRKEVKRKRPSSILLQPDLPVFDEEVANISYSDRFVCAPGVTFKDGQTVKSRPQAVNTSQMTRVQYESYLEEMKRSGEDGAVQ